MRAQTSADRLERLPASRLAPGVACALALTLIVPAPASAAGGTVTVELKPLSSAFPRITSTNVRIDLSFTGNHKRKKIKQVPLRIDLVDLSHQRERSFSLSGSGIGLIIPDPELASLSIKQLSVYDFKGTQLVYMRGRETVCIKQTSGQNLLKQMEHEFSPEALMGGAAMSGFKGKLVRTESVYGIPARRYAIIDATELGSFKRLDVWVAVRGSSLIKIDAVEQVTASDMNKFVPDFEGEMRLTYSIFGVNKTTAMNLPAECKNELSS
jgi:hypothetical protein